MAREHTISEIPEDRPLSDEERSFVQWMLEHGAKHATSFLAQLSQARVAGRCQCGCASINFSVAGKRPSIVGMDILSDYDWEDAQGHKFGAFVFARGGLLAGLDLYSIDGAVTPTWLPKPEQLHPSVFATPEV
jgi:hypothetical protein